MEALTGQGLAAEEYLARPPEDRFTQLVDEEIVVNQPAVRHQLLATSGIECLAVRCRSPSGGGQACVSVDVRFDDGNVVAPMCGACPRSTGRLPTPFAS